MTAYVFLQLINVPAIIRLPIIGASAAALLRLITHLNYNYSRHGLMKKLALKKIPPSVRADTRKAFQKPGSNT